MKEVFNDAESIEFIGKVVVKLAQDRNTMGSQISMEELFTALHKLKSLSNLFTDMLKFLAGAVPGFLKVPKFLITLFTSKF